MARRRSISVPITLASVAVALSIGLLVMWTMILARNLDLQSIGSGRQWLLAAGVFSFVTIMSVLVMFSIFLVRETLELRRQTTFIDSVTHELKSPLASIHLAAETLGRDGLDDGRRETLRSMILDDANRLSTLIDDILQATRLDDLEDEVRSLVDVRDVIDGAVARAARRHGVDAGAVLVDVNPNLKAWTAQTALSVVLVNLVDNALKYSDPPREISVVARLDGEDLKVVVSDNGIGISRPDLQRVTERFYRVPVEAVRARRGTGLGLFVVSGLLRRIGGKLTLHSGGVGTGTQCTVLIRDVTQTPPEVR